MGKSTRLTCDDCYFRQEALCALQVLEPCPTFRLSVRGQLAPPRQPPLVPVQRARPPGAPVATQPAAA